MAAIKESLPKCCASGGKWVCLSHFTPKYIYFRDGKAGKSGVLGGTLLNGNTGSEPSMKVLLYTVFQLFVQNSISCLLPFFDLLGVKCLFYV